MVEASSGSATISGLLRRAARCPVHRRDAAGRPARPRWRPSNQGGAAAVSSTTPAARSTRRPSGMGHRDGRRGTTWTSSPTPSGPPIARQQQHRRIGLRPDARRTAPSRSGSSWVPGTGNGVTSATIGRYIRYRRLATRLCVVDPENSAFLPPTSRAAPGPPARRPASRASGAAARGTVVPAGGGRSDGQRPGRGLGGRRGT